MSRIVLAAAEKSRPAIETIYFIVQSFKAVSTVMESTFSAMHMSYQALLGVAENYTRMKKFMGRMNSTIVSLKLVQWFLNKIDFLLSKYIVVLKILKDDSNTNNYNYLFILYLFIFNYLQTIFSY